MKIINALTIITIVMFAFNNQAVLAAIDRHSVNKTTDEDEDTWAPLQKVLDYWAEIISDRLAKAQSS